MNRPQAPEIFQKPIATIDMTGLPPRGSPNFDQAVIARYALLGLAQCLDELGGDRRREADTVYGKIARRFTDHPVAETAEMARNKIANEQLHDTVDGLVRMDAVFYMQGAMDQFLGKSPQEIGQIVMEIGLLGQGGLQINKPDIRYALRAFWRTAKRSRPSLSSDRFRRIWAPPCYCNRLRSKPRTARHWRSHLVGFEGS